MVATCLWFHPGAWQTRHPAFALVTSTSHQHSKAAADADVMPGAGAMYWRLGGDTSSGMYDRKLKP